MKIKQFRYIVSNIAGYFNDALEDGIDYQGIKSHIRSVERNRRQYERGESIVIPDYLRIAEEELKSSYKVKLDCDKFISEHNVKTVTVNNYTVHRHNNAGHDTVFESVTIIYD